MLPGVIHQNLAHQVGGDGEELRAIPALYLRLVHQTQIRLVNQRGWLEGVVAPLAAEISGASPRSSF